MMNNKTRFCNNIPDSAQENPIVKPTEHSIVYPRLPKKSTQAEVAAGNLSRRLPAGQSGVILRSILIHCAPAGQSGGWQRPVPRVIAALA